MTHHFTTLPSPVGELTLVAGDKGLSAVLWENDDPSRVPLGTMERYDSAAVLVDAAGQLGEYFAGKRRVFSVPLDFSGTDFQKSVWQALLTIPLGETRTYAQIARQIGNPKSVRAVGAANGRNPISIIAPCHRVIGSDGKLTGFAGGLPAKSYLLELEGHHPAQPPIRRKVPAILTIRNRRDAVVEHPYFSRRSSVK